MFATTSIDHHASNITIALSATYKLLHSQMNYVCHFQSNWNTFRKMPLKGQSVTQKNSFSITKFQVVFEKYFKTKFI